MREQAIGFVLRLGHAEAGFEAAHHGESIAPGSPKIHYGGYEDIDLHAGGEDAAEVEAGGEPADHSHRFSIHCNGFADDGGVAVELVFPEVIAEQRRRRAAFLTFLAREVA